MRTGKHGPVERNEESSVRTVRVGYSPGTEGSLPTFCVCSQLPAITVQVAVPCVMPLPANASIRCMFRAFAQRLHRVLLLPHFPKMAPLTSAPGRGRQRTVSNGSISASITSCTSARPPSGHVLEQQEHHHVACDQAKALLLQVNSSAQVSQQHIQPTAFAGRNPTQSPLLTSLTQLTHLTAHILLRYPE